ncbi:aminoglycoside phosphotransferase family protein [Glycomyces sp. NRRL B-16210]|uniref:aminoglycoside phosphotransferase family protein n=1 Tax=Glycomyces sp. NRRL B-16210 TaxID=1463821 RepID=UPI00068E7E02|nr:aminoglycoside phosphotransferase family protein [Glycomyces sp. NRRL B-16210]
MPFAPFPETLRQNLLDWYGDQGRHWLDTLPATLTRLAETWDLRTGGEPFTGGTTAYALPLHRSDGTPAVLKLDLLDEENRSEPTALRAYDGDGAVRLLEYDPESGAMLLERARPGTALLEHAPPGADERTAARERLAIACGIFRRLWRTPPPAEGHPAIPTATDLLKGWSERFDAAAANAAPEIAKDLALGVDLCAALADEGEIGIANRDNHLSNVIAAEREPWLLIDPKPVLAERAFDGGYFLFKQQFHGPLGGTELLRAVAEGLGADRERVRAWGMVRTIAQIADAGTGPDLAACTEVLRAIEGA